MLSGFALILPESFRYSASLSAYNWAETLYTQQSGVGGALSTCQYVRQRWTSLQISVEGRRPHVSVRRTPLSPGGTE